jgi:hypothetical protein
MRALSVLLIPAVVQAASGSVRVATCDDLSWVVALRAGASREVLGTREQEQIGRAYGIICRLANPDNAWRDGKHQVVQYDESSNTVMYPNGPTPHTNTKNKKIPENAN